MDRVRPISRSLLLGLVLACMLLALAIVQAPAAAGQPVLLDSFGTWTLRDLGYSDIFMPAGGGTVVYPAAYLPPRRYTDPVKYALPDGAAQEPATWYVIHFHFEIELQEDSGEGGVNVFAESNSYMAGRIEFNVARRDGALTVDWNSLGGTEGWQLGTSESRRVEIRFSNYFQSHGVVPGENSLLFAVEEPDEARFAMLHVFDDTSVQVTPLSPPELRIDAGTVWRPPASPGDIFEVPYTVSNLGGWPAKDVVVGVSYPEDALRLLGEKSVTTPLIDGWTEVPSSFKFQALSPGAYDITLNVHGGTGGGGDAGVMVTITADEAVSRVRWGLLVGLVVSLSALALVPYAKLLGLIRGRFRNS